MDAITLIELIVAVGCVIATVAIFFWRISTQAADNGEMLKKLLADHNKARADSQRWSERLCLAVEKLDGTIERSFEQQTKEHEALMRTTERMMERMESDHRQQTRDALEASKRVSSLVDRIESKEKRA